MVVVLGSGVRVSVSRPVTDLTVLAVRGPGGAQGPAGSGHIVGTGPPSGATLSAAVGTTYADSAVTMGASLWQKVAAPNTLASWRVIAGETGWRAVVLTPTANHPGIGSFLIIRRRNTIELILTESSAGAAGAGLTSLGTLPVGFQARASGAQICRVMEPTGGGALPNANFYISGSNTLTLYRSPAARHWIHGMWTTDAAWPTTLPGAAA